MRFMAWLFAMGLMVTVVMASPASAQQGGGPGGGGPGGGGERGGPGGGGPGGSTGSGFGSAPSGPSGNPGVPGIASPDGMSPGFGSGPGSAEADAVRDAVASGLSVPFNQVVATVENAMAGQIVGVNVSRRPTTGLAYTVKVLTDDGVLRQVTVDARSGAIMAVR